MKFAEQLIFAALAASEQNVARLCRHCSTSLGEESAGANDCLRPERNFAAMVDVTTNPS
jgi:hypothetical protein